MTVRIIVLLICVLFLTTLSTAKKNERKREYQQENPQNETIIDEDEGEDEDEDDEVDIDCRWRWSRWKPCSKLCDSGNTSRKGLCICEGFNVPFADSQCEDIPNHLGSEFVPCNEYACGEKPACNKVCWMNILSQNHRMNITDGVYECSMGCTTDRTCPEGKTYSQVLEEPVPSMAENVEWYYLAKEWYAAKLNQASGFPFPTLALEAMDQASQLLENCAGWGPDEMKLLAMVYAVKEKLNRANNGIGGLDQVDQQVAMMVGGDTGEGMDSGEGDRKSLLGLAISIPMIAVAIIAVSIMVSIYYVRRKSYVVVQPNESHMPESSLVDHSTIDLPLQDERKGEDSSSEEKI